MTRVKCSVLDRNRERIFSRIATRGVVKFFNVCNQEQKDIETKVKVIAGNSERKKDKILGSIDKGSFLDRLKENNDSDEDINQNKNQDQPSWSVLRDDFIMGSKLKDWENDDQKDPEASEEEDSDDDKNDHKKSKQTNGKPTKNFKNKKANFKNKKFKK